MKDIETPEEKIIVDGQNEPVKTESGLEGNPSSESKDNMGHRPSGGANSKPKNEGKPKNKGGPTKKGKSKKKGPPQRKRNVKVQPLKPEEAILKAIALMKAADTLDEMYEAGIQPRKGLAQENRNEAMRLLNKYGGKEWKQALEEAKKQAKSLTILHDIPFKVIFRGQKRLFARLLVALTGKKHIEIVELVLQLNLQLGDGVKGRILDSYAVDTEGNVYNLEPQINSSEANDFRGIDHLSHLKLEVARIGLDADVPREFWTIFLCQGDPKGDGKLLYHRSLGEYKDKVILHLGYFSCSVARKMAKDENAWQTPQDGIELERWQDLIRWGVDLSAENPHEMQNIQDDKLRQRVQFAMLTDKEGRVSPVTQELIDWHVQSNARSEARGEARGKAEASEEFARNLFAMGMNDAFVSQATGLDGKTVKKMRASMHA